jgi:hypothetical protein
MAHKDPSATLDKLSESQKEARRLLLEISYYILFDGVLYHSRVAKSKRAKQGMGNVILCLIRIVTDICF